MQLPQRNCRSGLSKSEEGKKIKYVQKKESSPDTEEKIRKAFPPALRQTIFTRMTPKTEEE